MTVGAATAWTPRAVASRIERAPGPWGHRLVQLFRFGWLEAQSCAFAVCVFVGLAVSDALYRATDPPIARYDALLLYLLAVTAVFWALRLETGRELLAIAGFHVVGLAFELFKVSMGSWDYPGTAVAMIAGVPLYSGFMYAAVGSYVVRAWRLLDLRLAGYRPWATAVVATSIYANFFTHHWLPDLRLVLAVAMVVVTWGCWVSFRVGGRRYRMPLSVSFGLIGFFLWLAENAATFLSAWRYPSQADAWTMVHPGRLGSWALLVTVSFVLVAVWKHPRGRLPTGGPLSPSRTR